MKKLFFLLPAILPTVLLAQSVELQVVDERFQPMPYAYVIINSRGVAVTDTLGYAVIDVSGYAHNDTIKASYLSTAGASVLIGEVLNKGNCHTFTLHQESFELNPTTIIASPKNARNKFFRETNITFWLAYDCICHGDFTYAFFRNVDEKHAWGQFTATKINDNKEKGITPTFSGPLEIFTSSDTTGLKKPLLSDVLRTISMSNFLIGAIYSKTQSIVPFYTYLGKSDGVRQYRIVYKEGYGGMYYQIIAYIDAKTKDLIAYDCSIMGEINEYPYMVRISCEVARFIHKKPKLYPVLVPRSIRYNIKFWDGSGVKVTMDNMVYNYIKAKR